MIILSTTLINVVTFSFACIELDYSFCASKITNRKLGHRVSQRHKVARERGQWAESYLQINNFNVLL